MLSESPRVVPATPQQEGIWFHAMGNMTSYWNFIYVKGYRGRFNVPVLQRALQGLLDRHSSLRSTFSIEGGRLCQVIPDRVSVDAVFRHTRYEIIYDDDAGDIVRTELTRLRHYDFDPGKDLLWRCQLMEFSDVSFLLVGVNHLITDAFSMQIFWRELYADYNGGWGHRAPGRQYADVSMTQSELALTDDYRLKRQYWLDKFADGCPVLSLPFCDGRSPHGSYHREIVLPANLAEDIRSFSLQNRVLYSAVFQLAYFILLYKYSGQTDVVIGNIINGRGFGKSINNEVIGVFANRLMNRIRLERDETLQSLLLRVHQELMETFENSEVPYEAWTRALIEKEKSGLSPLFRAAFNLIRNVGKEAGFAGMDEYPAPDHPAFPDADTQYDVYLYVIDSIKEVRLRIELKCNEPLRAMTELVADSYVSILQQCVYGSGSRLGDMKLQTEKEEGLLRRFNDTAVPLPPGAVVHGLFRRQALTDPDGTAILFKGQRISYRELDEASDRLAAVLAAHGAGRGKWIGLLLGRSPRIIVGMLAVLKAGAAYLPLDPAFPAARLSYMLKDARAFLTITEKGLAADGPVLYIEDISGEGGHVEASVGPDDLAYVIYTSGSTGNPKGVMIPHRAVVNFIEGISRLISFRGKLVYSMTTVSFDIFVLESLLALCCGSTVALATAEELEQPEKAVGAMSAYGAQLLQCTPSRLKMLLNTGGFLSGLSDLLIGGEPLPADVLERVRSMYSGRIFNMYGPTETTVWSTVQELTERGAALTIGRPIGNTRVYILDATSRTAGIGVYGEIGIAGDGVARGYLGQEALTAEKFIELPGLRGERIYRTGDIGRWLPDGQLDIIGRKDDQLKLRGYRVEPGEIEAALKEHESIRDAVVLPAGGEDLYAWYLASAAVPVRELREHLRSRLPEYMIPAHFHYMTSFPHTPNNKIDKPALRALSGPLPADLPVPDEAIDAGLLELWTTTLQVDGGSFSGHIFTDFFEAGGHSLKAIRLLEDIRARFNRKIPLRDFFRTPTLYYLNECLSQTSNQ